MDFIGIIPARYHSVRFLGKPLVDLAGKSMILRTYEQVIKVKKFADVVVATDDERIYNEIVSSGGKAIMTANTHTSGTERAAEAFIKLNYEQKNTVIVNIQGDEPFIKPQQIEELIDCFDNPNTKIATLIKKINNEEMLHNSHVVKAVISDTGKALYFSRSAIPFLRDKSFTDTVFYKHIGIYAYKSEVLNEIIKLPSSSLEEAESLEQLRWLQAGYEIQTYTTHYEDTIGIDTMHDVEKALLYIKNNNL